MEIVIGILLLISFFGLAWYCIKGHNLMIGFLLISVIWAALSLGGTALVSSAFIEANPILGFMTDENRTLVTVLNGIFQAAPEGWGTTLVNVLWGAWFGRVLMETGIASTIIRKTVELGGDRPLITIVLLNIVVSIIFTAMTGAGPVIAIGVIVLPILMSLGIPKGIAMFTFMGAVASGIYINPINFEQYRMMIVGMPVADFPEFTLQFWAMQWGLWAMIINVVVTTALTAFFLHRNKTRSAWAAQTGRAPEQKNAPWYTLFLPIIPVVLNIWLNFSVIAGFIIAGFLALFLTKTLQGNFREKCQQVNKMYFDGVVDTAPLIGFLLSLPMFNAVAAFAAPYFGSVIGPIMPTSEIVIIVAFAIVLGLGLFRGPMTLVGSGAATLGVLRGVGSFSVPFTYAVFVIPTITVNIGSCITQSWVAWGLSYTKVESREFLKLSIPNAYVAGILIYIMTIFTVTGMGASWFL